MSRHATQGEAQQQRVVRVFVSSTFRDMQAERDELLKRVFPQLDKLCRSRGVAWSEVDLRWGITDEQKAEGKVLPTCLAEINNCRPFFISLLGERYGWVPDELPPELILQEPWLAAFQARSVTEIEIAHGALNEPQRVSHAFFYFRSPSYINSLPRKHRPEYVELPTAQDVEQLGREKAERLADKRKEKLESLKQRIRASGLPVREDYSSPQELGELVLRDLTETINRLFPEGSEPDMLEREVIENEEFAASLRRVYIERPGYLTRLDQHAASDDSPLVVTGESGSGKSALLANWAARYRAAHPDEYLMTRFVGAFAPTTDWTAMSFGIIVALGLDFNLPKSLLKKSSEMTIANLRESFADALRMASSDRRVILILDGLDYLNNVFGDLNLFRLPEEIPPNVRLIVSAGPGRMLDALNSRGWPTLEVEPLKTPERRRFINDYLNQYKKAISPPRAERIAKAGQTANPLYLQTLLAELRLYGDHDTLDERIDYYLEARTLNKLYERILERYEQDYDREREHLVRDAMSFLYAAHFGLSEPDLLNLLGSNGQPLPHAYWSPLLLAAGQSLMSRGGLLTFAHDFVRQAVQKRYLSTQSKRRAVHLRLADYLQTVAEARQKVGDDKSQVNVAEVPWQLFKAKAWKRLASLLSDPKILLKIWLINEYDVRMYWSQIESGSALRLEDVYRPILDDPAGHPEYVPIIGALLARNGRPEVAALLEQRLAEHYEQAGHKQLMADSLANQASFLMDRGESDQAMALLKRHEQICRELKDRAGLALSLGNQAVILMERAELDSATDLLKKEEQICREIGDEQGVAHSLGNQAAILKHRGQLREALALYREEERIYLKYGLRDEATASRIEQAHIQNSLGELNSAMTQLKKEEKLTRESEDKLALAQSLAGQADLLTTAGKLDKALRLYQRQESLCREIGALNGLAYSLRNQGVVLQIMGDLDGATAAQKKHEQLAREIGNEDELARSLGNQALILKERGNFDEAMLLHKQEESICRKLGDRQTLAHSLGNQATILSIQGEADRAIALRKEEEGICRELGDPRELARCLINQALILGLSKGRAREALPLAEEAYRLASEHNQSALIDRIRPILELIRSEVNAAPKVRVATPPPHPKANAARESQLNIEYQQKMARWREELAQWKALPFWRRLLTKKPVVPKGI